MGVIGTALLLALWAGLALGRRRLGGFWAPALFVISLIIWLATALEPALPGSVLRLWSATIVGAAALFVSSSRERLGALRGGLTALVVGRQRRLWQGLVVAIPLGLALHGLAELKAEVPAPATFRAIHPAPPTSIEFREPGQDEATTVGLVAAPNPLRAAAPGAFTAHVEAGRDLYIGHCFFCHGADLDGDGPFAEALAVRPTSFRDPGTIAILEESYLFWRVAKGAAGLPPEGTPERSAMPAWEGVLSSEQIWQVILFLYEHTGQEPRGSGENEQVRRVAGDRPSEPAEGVQEPSVADPRSSAPELWTSHCAWCHGADGGGDAPHAERMYPRPRAFLNNPAYKRRSTASGELPLITDVCQSIRDGLPGSAMPGWPRLSQPERRALTAWLESTTSEFVDPLYQPGRVALPELAVPIPPATPELLARGAQVYAEADCRKCHGDAGRGNGPSWMDQVDDTGLPADPADLTRPDRFRAGATVDDVFRTLSTGLDGSAMASFADTVSVEDRQALAWHVLSLTAPEQPTSLVVAPFVETFDPADEAAWSQVPASAVVLGPQLVRAPRLLWPSVDRVTVQAAHTGQDLHLRLRWHDREASTDGDETVRYPDFDTTPHRSTHHPDRVAIQFQPGRPEPSRLPPFLLGDAGHPVDVWTATAAAPSPVEAVARGGAAIADKPESLTAGGMTWADGRWTLQVSRPLTTDHARRDVQLEPGAYAPMGLSVWDGSRGEVGTRRSTSSWLSLYLAPPPSRIAAVAPLGRALVALLLMLAIGAMVGRWHDPDAT